MEIVDDKSDKNLKKLAEDVKKKDLALQNKIADDINQLEDTDKKLKQELTKIIGNEKKILDKDQKFIEKIQQLQKKDSTFVD